MKDTNVFNHIICPWRYFSNWLKNIKTIGRGIKWSYQRITKGYCDRDTWNLDRSICDYLYGTLKQLSATSHSWPDNKFKTFEEWHDYLSKMADFFYKANLENNYYKNEYEEKYLNGFYTEGNNFLNKDTDLTKKYFNREKEIFRQQQEDLRAGLKMLENVFYTLWD